MQIKVMGGFLDGIDGDRHLQTRQTIIDGMDIYRWDRLYRRDRHLIDKINYYRQMDGMGNMRQDKPQKKRDTCWQKC